MKKNTKKKSSGFFATMRRWFKRMFFGAGKVLADELEEQRKKEAELSEEEMLARAKAADIEEVVSPARQIFRNFVKRKTAVVAVFIVLAMFLTVFIAPYFMPNYSDTYTETTQKNLPPTLGLMRVPKELKDDIKMIDSYSTFSVGLSNAGKVYVWGVTDLGTLGIDIADIPEEVQNAKIEFVSAGFDHIVAISAEGKVYAWGNSRLGQYETAGDLREESPSILPMPEKLVNGTIDVANVKKLECGYQATVILMNDGSYYIWGNKNAYSNLDRFKTKVKYDDIAFTLNNVVAIRKNAATSIYTGKRGLYTKLRANLTDPTAIDMSKYLAGRKIKSLTTSSTMICLTLSDGSIAFAGDIPQGYIGLPTLAADETVVQVEAGSFHFTVLTSKGNVYSIGRNTMNQCNVSAEANNGKVTKIFSGSCQNYAVDAEGDLVTTWGLKGYIFGTDKNGAPIFERVINGGRMTMTVGAVAVIISSIIGIIVGCVSGYFGGKVDVLLMRITEIFAAIPFLPFAMILSAIMGRMTISETGRILIIMCILGVLSWTGLARLVRGQVLSARENEYVIAAKAMGVKESSIAFRHILPNVISVIIVTLTLDFATCMLTESSLSYLGFGVQFPRPTWGNMLNAASNSLVIKNYWWQWVFPAIFLAVTTICINIIGDTLRDVMDPKSSAER